MEKVKFELEDGNEVEFYVEEQTRVNGRDYLLVSDSQDDEAQAYILKDMSAGSDTVARYEIVEDDVELEVISKVFAQMMDDVDFQM